MAYPGIQEFGMGSCEEVLEKEFLINGFVKRQEIRPIFFF